MTTVSGTFTAVGSSGTLRIRRKESVQYAISGTFVGTWVIEQDAGGGQAWIELASGTAAESDTIPVQFGEGRVRVRCSAHTSGTITYSINDTIAVGEQFFAPSGVEAARVTDTGFDLLNPAINGVLVTSSAVELNALDAAPVAFTVALAASGTTDGMDITVTAVDAAGNTIAGVYLFEMWVSEAATGIGLTADTASGDLTWGTGTEWEEIVSKKHYRVLTATTGIAVATLVDSANPTDQYIAVANPFNAGKLIVSAASGTNWEGA